MQQRIAPRGPSWSKRPSGRAASVECRRRASGRSPLRYSLLVPARRRRQPWAPARRGRAICGACSRSAVVAPMRLICKWCDQAVRINWRHDSRPIGDARVDTTRKVRGQKAKTQHAACLPPVLPRSEANFEATSSLAAEMPSTKQSRALIPRISTTTAANAMQVA